MPRARRTARSTRAAHPPPPRWSLVPPIAPRSCWSHRRPGRSSSPPVQSEQETITEGTENRIPCYRGCGEMSAPSRFDSTCLAPTFGMLPSVIKNGTFAGSPLSFQACTTWLTNPGSRKRSPGRSDLFGCTRSKPSQGSVPADLTLASDLAFVFNASRVRPECCGRPIETTALITRGISSDLRAATSGCLLVPQTIDRVEVGRDACRIIAEKQAHADRDRETNRDPEIRQRCGNRREKRAHQRGYGGAD